MRHKQPLQLAAVLSLSLMLSSFDDGRNAGIGKYPGAPGESFAPELVADNSYRNIALRRMAYASSSHDYNLTAQLVTDGIVHTAQPPYLTASTNSGVLPRREREWAIDGGEYTRNILMGQKTFLNYQWHNMKVKANRVKIICSMAYNEGAKGGYAIKVSSRMKGKKGVTLRTLGQQTGKGLPGKASNSKAHSDPNKNTNDGPMLPTRNIEAVIDLGTGDISFDNLKVEFSMPGAAHWTVTEIKFFDGNRAVTDVLPSSEFGSAWMSAKAGTQWVYVDLGTSCEFDKVRLHWISKARSGRIETSDDARNWKTVAQLPTGNSLTDEVKCAGGKGRYVRVLMLKGATTAPYVLSEIEVMGRGGLVAKPQPVKGGDERHFSLDGGDWRIQRASEVKGDGQTISADSYDDSSWAVATVPATALMSYVNIGALPNPNYADNLMQISESFFNSDFWYRTEFDLPQQMKGKRVFLNFDGINWKADVFVNGRQAERIEGAFMRGHADITPLLRDGRNVLAVKITKNAHPGAVKEKYRKDTDFNGGLLGYDNPTFHATIGWDWISTIRGRNIGIWNDVWLSATGAVSMRDPLVTSKLALPDTAATITPSVILTNHMPYSVSGTLRGWIGDLKFEKRVVLPTYGVQEIAFLPEEFPELRNRRMNLWWPNGYGTPYLYDAGFEFVTEKGTSDAVNFKAGIRQMDYKDMDTQLKIYINGRRFVPLGGNWGFSENNLCYRGREYDIAVKNHRDMNFNMIRNWVGQTGDEEFYEACDKYGIMVWQDFWLANPADGPDPLNEYMFLSNADDYVKRIRNHPSIGIYCGRNEGYPPETIDKQLREDVKTLHPGLGYISSSADDGVSGHGPYWALPPKEYFDRQTGKLHSERGMPNVMTYEGLARTLSPETLWPQGNEWGQHDYCMQGAQRGATFNAIIEKAFGKVDDAATFTKLAQWQNYDGYRAMYESGSRDRQGLLIWMSHACWPSMTWQCYDYYFEPTAAFFGCKKACEPLHIQWNASTRNVEVVNLCAGDRKNLTAKVELTDAKGHTVKTMQATVNSNDDSTVVPEGLHVDDKVSLNGGNVYFIRLWLNDESGRTLSQNFYVASNDEGNLQELNTLPQVALSPSITTDGTRATVTVKNTSDTPAMMIRLNLKAGDGEQILPVSYSDNYFHLMPGESRTVEVSWNAADARDGKAVIELSGFNVKYQKIQ